MNITSAFIKKEPWKQVNLLLPLLLVGIILLYSDSVVSMVKIWLRSGTFAHGILIFPISIYLLWQKREIITSVTPQVDRRGLVLLILFSIIWLMAAFANITVLQHFALILLIITATASMLGIEVTKIIAFPLFYLLFAVPAGEALIGPLQDFTASFVVAALNYTGIPVLLEGRYFSIPSGDFEVAKACSGIRYLMVTIALGTVYAYLMYTGKKKRLLFIGLCIITPIIANGLRAYGIVMLAHLSNMQLAVGVDHFIYGWIFFGLIIFVLFWFGSQWKDKNEKETNYISESPRLKNNYLATAILIMACSAIAPIVYAYASTIEIDNNNIAIDATSNKLGWMASQDIQINWAPHFKSPTQVMLRKYKQKEHDVYVFAALYANEKQGAELINSENVLYNPEHWMRMRESKKNIGISDEKLLNINEVILRSKGKNMIIWSWYNISGNEMASKYWAKLYQAWVKISGNEAGSAIIAVAATYENNQSDGENILRDFVMTMWPVVTFNVVNTDGN